MTESPREAAERYRFEKWQREQGFSPDDADTGTVRTPPPHDAGAPLGGSGSADPGSSPPSQPARAYSAADRAAVVETAIQQAIRRGDFDDLPGAGKPIPGLSETHDPDWWIRRKIETEQLSGLGPPALMLRVEHAELDDKLDALSHEADVREALEDFNRRVIEARRQLRGGPPVVTPTRDVDADLAAWRDRRAAHAEAAERDADPPRRRPWWRRPRG